MRYENEIALKKWRLLLGEEVGNKLLNKSHFTLDEILSDIDLQLDNTLNFLYEDTNSISENSKEFNFKVINFLTDVQNLFTPDMIEMLYDDAIQKNGIKDLLVEPDVLENLEPDINVLETIILLKDKIPPENKEVVRRYIEKVVKKINDELNINIKRSVIGALNKKQNSKIENFQNMDITKTIDKNLKNYDMDKKKLLAQEFYFFDSVNTNNNWTIILDVDQSGSMGSSIIYSTIISTILYSINSINTEYVAFNTKPYNLSRVYNNPTDMLLGTQLGGGTDINLSIRYCRSLIKNSKKTIFILISDLFEDGVESELLANLQYLKNSGVRVINLLAISDNGRKHYNKDLAMKINEIGIPSFFTTPDMLPSIFKKLLTQESFESFNLKYTKKDI